MKQSGGRGCLEKACRVSVWPWQTRWLFASPRRLEMKATKLSFSGNTVRQAVAHTLAGCVRLLHERTILVLMILFCFGMGGMLWYVSRLQSNLIASIALQDAALYAQALAEFRTLYTSEVVETVRQHGIAVTHTDRNFKRTFLPVPPEALPSRDGWMA